MNQLKELPTDAAISYIDFRLSQLDVHIKAHAYNVEISSSDIKKKLGLEQNHHTGFAIKDLLSSLSEKVHQLSLLHAEYQGLVLAKQEIAGE